MYLLRSKNTTGTRDSIPGANCQFVGAPGTPEPALGWTTAILSH